jgi:hypothetical protein
MPHQATPTGVAATIQILVAARPVGLSWSVHADPVYRLLNTDGLGGSAPPAAMPAPDQPLKTGTIGYHLRSGKHDITAYDWQQYLDFAQLHLQLRPRAATE